MVSVVMRTINTKPGFTFSELLVALVVLGIVAALTIPMILHAHSNARNNAIAKECAGILTGAYQQYRFKNPAITAANFRVVDLIPYVNAVSTVPIDAPSCMADNVQCIRLQNSTVLEFHDIDYQYWPVFVDNRIAGEVFVNLDGLSQSENVISLWIREDGRLRTGGTKGFLVPPDWDWSPHDEDPQWFRW